MRCHGWNGRNDLIKGTRKANKTFSLILYFEVISMNFYLNFAVLFLTVRNSPEFSIFDLKLIRNSKFVSFTDQQMPAAPQSPAKVPRMPDLAKQFQALIGQFMKMISDLLKQLTGMDLNAFLQILPGKGQKVMQVQQKLFGLLGKLSPPG